MESLYVCLFSNGHIKVGRSVDPVARIAQHRERVSCVGVTLDASEHFPCTWSITRAEAELIARCGTNAKARHKNEWFVGLQYADVLEWAKEVSTLRKEQEPAKPELDPIDYDRPDFKLVMAHLKAAKRTQTEVATYCGCSQSSICDIANGVTKDPSFSVGFALLRLARSVEQVEA